MPDSVSSSLRPEGPPPGGPANPISLTDVLALHVPIHWSEAVAIVEELCSVLTEHDSTSSLVPELQDILITSLGTVMVRRGAEATQEIDGLGRTLHVLLDAGMTPMPLRLFVAHAVGSEKYGSVGAFAEALAYYARPGRAEMIEALHRRCLDTTVPAAAPIHEPEPKAVIEPPAPLVEAPRRKLPRWAIVTAAALVFVVAGVVVVRVWGSHPKVTSSVASLQGVVASAAAAVRDFTMSRATEEPVPVAEEPPSAVAANRPARSREPRRDPETVIVPDITVDASSLLTAPLPEVTGSAGNVADLGADGALAVPTALSAALEGDGVAAVYSSAASDVQPPVMFSPKLPSVAPANVHERGTNTMELLIDETGHVAQARLVSRPIRMPDMMLLSGAKTWKFHPALKDGKPVKYRLALSWVVTPP